MATNTSGPGLATGADTEALVDLWVQSFGDPERYIRNFQSLVATPEQTVVYREDGKAVSAVYLLDCQLELQGERYNAYYFYAAATHPDYRRRGYMEQIIRYCRTLAEERNIDFIILVPADNNLYQYYSRFGFRANFYLKTTRLSGEQLAGLVEKMNPEPPEEEPSEPAIALTELPRVRNEALKDGTYVHFPDRTLQYMLFEHVYCGGKTLLKEDGYVLYDVSEEETGTEVLTVKELCTTGNPGTLLSELLKEDAKEYVLNLPAFDTIRGGKTATGRAGMDLAVSKRAVQAERTMKNAYIGLTLG